MAETETFQGFVPVTVLLPGKRIEGKAWKSANRRLLQQIEEDNRQFLPLVSARVYELERPGAKEPDELPVLAVSTRHILALVPGDAVTSVGRRRLSGRVPKRVRVRPSP